MLLPKVESDPLLLSQVHTKVMLSFLKTDLLVHTSTFCLSRRVSLFLLSDPALSAGILSSLSPSSSLSLPA